MSGHSHPLRVVGDVKTYEGVSMKRHLAEKDRMVIKIMRVAKDLEKLNAAVAEIILKMNDRLLTVEEKVRQLEQNVGDKRYKELSDKII